jgi:hypothetical protein
VTDIPGTTDATFGRLSIYSKKCIFMDMNHDDEREIICMNFL